ncbi:MAG: hypothetical protein NZ811_05035 [Gammaproteobacteria bacterium]|jgi:hypothetical protein|nr:hypothetical protein [Gammaproteobacteria bacterium]
MIKGWEISLGLYPGVLFGFRSYVDDKFENHVLYIPFIDLCITIEREVDEEE